jgi:Mce-associated membrane protein
MTTKTRKGIGWHRVLLVGVLPGIALLLALAGGYVKFVGTTVRDSQDAGTASIQAARDAAVAMLSYQPDTVERQLDAAKDRLTGPFRDSYSALTHDVVIPGAKQQRISTVATVPAAATVSASEHHAVVLLFINQTATVGTDAPSATRSTVLATLDKVNDRWLVSDFQPQ